MGRPGFTPRGGRGGGGGGGSFRGGSGGNRSGGGGNRGGGNSFRGGNRGGGGGFRRDSGNFGNEGGKNYGGSPRGRDSSRGRGSPRGGGGRGSPRGGGGGGMRRGRKVMIEPHRFEGIYIVRGKEDALATKNMAVGISVYGEKRISVPGEQSDPSIEYRVWNPFRSKLAAAVMAGIGEIHIKPGTKVLYLGAASGTTVSHVSDIVGSEGIVYAVEFSHRSGRDLLSVAKQRPNIVPIIEDARHPHKYAMILGIVDTIFADVAQPNQAQIVCQNAHKFLKNGGHCVISIKANCIDSTAEPEAVFAGEVEKLKTEKFTPIEQISLEPYERDHAVVVARYDKKKKANSF